MKQLFLSVVFMLASLYSVAQTINYQAVARDTNGDILINTTIGVQFMIRQSTPTGTVIYTETHSTTTSEYGLFNLPLGGGTTTDSFTTIDWSNTHFLETLLDITGGTNYTSIGATEFRAVPYAIYAGSSPGDGVGILPGTSSNMQPYATIRYYIAVVGTFPFRSINVSDEILKDPHVIPQSKAVSTSPYLAEIMPFAGVVIPNGWAECNGQLLSIASNTALFSIMGTAYGGDGETNFALPDLRGRTPIHNGQGPGLSNRSLGEKSGSETVD